MSIDKELFEEIVASVEQGFADQVAFTQELVRFPSVRAGEAAVQNHVAEALRARGYAVDLIRMDRDALAGHVGGSPWTEGHSDAPLVSASHTPAEVKGRSLILQGHVDVVPTGQRSMWKHDPFDPVIEGDWMYGRGAGDMKAGHAASIFALDALARLGLQPAAPLLVHSLVEEESTGNGAMMMHLAGYKVDAALVPEPVGEQLVRANVGVLWFQVQVSGLPVHVRETSAGANAIDAAYKIIAFMRTIEAEWNERKAGKPNFENAAHPINLNVGKIRGGDWASTVPSYCEVDFRLAIFPGTPAAEAVAELRARLAAFVASDPALKAAPPRLVLNGFHTEGYELAPGSDAERTLGDAHLATTGDPLASYMIPAYIDSRVYALYDQIPALVYGPLCENAHSFDERVSLSSLKRTTATIAAFIADWCKVEKLVR